MGGRGRLARIASGGKHRVPIPSDRSVTMKHRAGWISSAVEKKKNYLSITRTGLTSVLVPNVSKKSMTVSTR